MNAYCNAGINGNKVWLSASANSSGLVSGRVELFLDGTKLNGADWNENPSWSIPETGPPISETRSTSSYGVELTKDEDATVYAYVDGADAQGNNHGRKHQIEWKSNDGIFTCFIETRVNGDWQRAPSCTPPSAP